MNRRELLKIGAASGLAAALPLEGRASVARKPLRIAHVTDVHVLPSETARGGFARAMEAVYHLKPRPELILIGGDCVMDATNTPTGDVRKQWAEWHAVLRDFREIPLHPILGNHDYHWTADAAGDSQAHHEEGAKIAMRELGMERRFHSFDHRGWRFIGLDSMSWIGRGYFAKLDDPQMEWLRAEFARTPKTMPIVVTSHIPIFSACAYLEDSARKPEAWEVAASWMHVDAIPIKDLLRSHGNVRLCLSGHMHQLDDITLSGLRFVCGGAVCGNWWKGRYHDTDPGVLIADLHADGQVETRYLSVSTPLTR